MRYVRNLSLFTISLLVLAFVLGIVALAWLQARSIIYTSRFAIGTTPAAYGMSTYREVTLTTSDDIDLAAWYVPPPDGANAAIIYLHGLGSNRAHMLREAELLYNAGYGALLLDLRRHGGSEGEFVTMGVEEVMDVQAAVDYLLKQPEVSAERIGLIGPSLGGSVALLSAAHIPEISGVIAISPYSSFLEVVGEGAQRAYRLPQRPTADLVMWFARVETGVDYYGAAPLAVIDNIAPRPVLLIHGRLDGTSSYRNSERLYSAAGEPRDLWILDDVGHGGFYELYPEAYETRLLSFFEEAL